MLCDFDHNVIISIHALREEGDVDLPAPERRSAQFLSTPSARRATSLLIKSQRQFVFLSTPSARRATSTLTVL